MRKALPWILALVASLALAGTPLAAPLNIWTAHAAVRVAGPTTPDWTVVWPVGNVVVTTLLLVLATFGRRRRAAERLAAWGLFALGLLVEAGSKHLGLGNAAATLARIPRPGPPAAAVTDVTHAVSRLLPGGLYAATRSRLHLIGTFPSGHVWRLTFLAGYALGRPGWLLPAVVAALTGFAVVVRAGHALTDALGGAMLAMALLAWAGRLRTR